MPALGRRLSSPGIHCGRLLGATGRPSKPSPSSTTFARTSPQGRHHLVAAAGLHRPPRDVTVLRTLNSTLLGRVDWATRTGIVSDQSGSYRRTSERMYVSKRRPGRPGFLDIPAP